MTRQERTDRARALRQTSGLAERRTWSLLRGGRCDGFKFRRQHPIDRYYADFACEALRLVIELDGGVHERDEVVLNDHYRQLDIEALGWVVIRFTNAQALGEPHQITDAVRDHARRVRSVPHPPTQLR
jgi:very-short-patch-repair endonuclease